MSSQHPSSRRGGNAMELEPEQAGSRPSLGNWAPGPSAPLLSADKAPGEGTQLGAASRVGALGSGCRLCRWQGIKKCPASCTCPQMARKLRGLWAGGTLSQPPEGEGRPCQPSAPGPVLQSSTPWAYPRGGQIPLFEDRLWPGASAAIPASRRECAEPPMSHCAHFLPHGTRG